MMLDEVQLREMIQEAAPLVAMYTGWDLDLDNLNVKFLPKKGSYEAIKEKPLEQLGIDCTPRNVYERVQRALRKYSFENMFDPTYYSWDGTIYVIDEKLQGKNKNDKSIMTSLATQLFFRGLHVNHPEYVEELNATCKDFYGSSCYNRGDEPKFLALEYLIDRALEEFTAGMEKTLQITDEVVGFSLAYWLEFKGRLAKFRNNHKLFHKIHKVVKNIKSWRDFDYCFAHPQTFLEKCGL